MIRKSNAIKTYKVDWTSGDVENLWSDRYSLSYSINGKSLFKINKVPQIKRRLPRFS